MASEALTLLQKQRPNLWAVNEESLVRLLKEEDATLSDLKDMLDIYQRSNDVVEVLCCLLLISKKEAFDAQLKTTFSYTSQQPVKRIREVWGSIKEYYGLPKSDDKTKSADLMRKSIESIHDEINFLVTLVIEISNNHLERIKGDENPSEKIYYMKINADYSRYLAEVCPSESSKVLAQKHNENSWEYIQSLKPAPNNSDYLGMALNFSVFAREILHKPEYAIEILKERLTAAQEYYDNEENRSENDKSPNIMILMEDNLDLWTNENNVIPSHDE